MKNHLRLFVDRVNMVSDGLLEKCLQIKSERNEMCFCMLLPVLSWCLLRRFHENHPEKRTSVSIFSSCPRGSHAVVRRKICIEFAYVLVPETTSSKQMFG